MYYRTVRVDKDEKALDLESSRSLMTSARASEGMNREEVQAANSLFWGEVYLRRKGEN